MVFEDDLVAKQPRQEHRIFVRGEIRTRERQRHESPARLVDISAHGCRVELLSKVNIGDTVWVRLPGIQPICARVQWADEYLAGLHFENPIHSAVLRAIVDQLKGV